MAYHHFGIMQKAPAAADYYCDFEPEKYNCIAVIDDDLDIALARIQADSLDTYWHKLSNPHKGLAYCGITLIPPASHCTFIDALEGIAALDPLKVMLMQAETENKFVIHFGV